MADRIKSNAGPSPRYCGVCGGRIADMRPGTCVNGTDHIPEPEMERPSASSQPEPDTQ